MTTSLSGSGVGHTVRAPASSLQSRYLDDALDGRSNVNLLIAARVTGRFDRDAFTWCLAELVNRHEALRTSLVRRDDGDWQLISTDPPPVPLEHLSLPADSRGSDADVAAVLGQAADRPVSLEGPLVHAWLVRPPSGGTVVALSVHHAVCDDWSCTVIYRDLLTLYHACVHGRRPTLAQLDVQFRDHSELERQPVADASSAHWRELLEPRELAFEPPAGTDWAEVPKRLIVEPGEDADAETTSALLRLAAAERATPTIAFIAASAAAIAPRAHGERVVLLVVHANRFDWRFAGVVGMFADATPVCVDVSGAPTFAELLRRTRDAWLASLGRLVPLAALDSLAPPGRRWPVNAFFDAAVNYIPLPDARASDLIQAGDEPVLSSFYVELDQRDIRIRKPDYGLIPCALCISELPRGGAALGVARMGDMLSSAESREVADTLSGVIRAAADAPTA